MAGRRGRDPRRLYGHSRHPDHQLVAERHRGRARRLVRRRQLDFHGLSHGRDHRDPADGLARLDLRVAALPRGQHRTVHRLLDRLRAFDEPSRDDPVPGRPGLHGRRSDPDRHHDRADPTAEIAAGGRHRVLRPHGHLRARHRPDGRWLADRQSLLALHLLPKPRARPARAGAAALRARCGAAAPRRARQGRLARHRPDGDRPAGSHLRARGRPTKGLVRLADHRRGHVAWRFSASAASSCAS